MSSLPINSANASAGFSQGIQCGELALALPYGWSRMVVDEFTVTPVPRAPFWLVGASSINGTVTPVVDLQLFALGENALIPQNVRRKPRLLIGGDADTESNKTLGILFDGLPIQIEPSAEFFHDTAEHYKSLGNSLTGQLVRQRERVYRMLAPEILYEVLTSHLSRH